MALDKIIADITDTILGGVNDYEIAALSSLQGLFLQRIHNDRQTTSGSSLGQYRSAQHKKKRVEAGRQVGEKDLEFYGNLRRSVKIGTSGGKNVMGFDNDMSRLIAEGQEGQIKEDVYTPSNSELNEMTDAYFRELDFRLNKF
jgi:hypothetical protein